MNSVTPAQQLFRLRRNAIYGGEGHVSHDVLTWRYLRRPSIFSRKYLLRINFKRGDIPQIFVDDPDLKLLADGRTLPHVYNQRPLELCLYLPGTGEWTPKSFIDETIMPWADLWLYYYEEWLFSDDWKGGGMHADPNAPASRRERRWAARGSGRRPMDWRSNIDIR